MQLVGLIIRIYHDARSPERQILDGSSRNYRGGVYKLDNQGVNEFLLQVCCFVFFFFWVVISILFFSFYIKLTFISFLFLWARGALPRFLYDNVMYLARRRFLPLIFCFLLVLGVLIFSAL